MSSSVAKHTIPPFYACYFLRSLSSPGTTYIGSTPAPPRRKRQHNGDLTQGAHKTARSRPWEMECIVYGFSSKIAALQFEWAWAKPHLSRHLKFLTSEHALDGTQVDTSAWAGMPLFPSTSMTTGLNRWGKPKRRISRPRSTPNARLIAMRALLRSEPFCGWGLKLAFFSEWSWLAFQRLDAANHVINIEAAQPTSMLQLGRHSRSGKPLHPLYPVAVCDFSGVDGKRSPLNQVSPQQRIDAGIADQLVDKRRISTKKKVDVDETPQWPEALPKTANLKGLDACIQDFATFPSPPPPLPNTDLTQKPKRVTKASNKSTKEQNMVEEEEEADDNDVDPVVTGSVGQENGFASMSLLHRMRFNDLDVEESEWKRFEQMISTRFPASTKGDAVQAMSNFMQICVQRHVAAQDARTLNDIVPAPTSPCALCREPIDLTLQLDFVLCPSPHKSTLPIASTTPMAESESSQAEDLTCSSVYHLSCLADSFLKQQGGGEGAERSTNNVLPTHGLCPDHAQERKEVALWADVIRAMYRRSERFERLLHLLVRSGRSLTELMNAKANDAVAKTAKSRGRIQAASGDAQVEVDGEEITSNQPAKRTKTAGGRKVKPPAASIADAEKIASQNAQTAQATVAEGKVTTKTALRKPKAVDATQVIDLT